MTNRSTTLTVAQAAALLGRSERWVQEIARAGYIQKSEPGRYGIAALIRGAISYYEDQIEKSRKAAVSTKATDARTREIELRIADRMRDLIPQADVLEVVDRMAAMVRDEFSGLPARFARDRKRRRELGREVEAALARVDDAAEQARGKLGVGFEE